jgi:hypothetical protein
LWYAKQEKKVRERTLYTTSIRAESETGKQKQEKEESIELEGSRGSERSEMRQSTIERCEYEPMIRGGWKPVKGSTGLEESCTREREQKLW